jgi:hypothetical protein
MLATSKGRPCRCVLSCIPRGCTRHVSLHLSNLTHGRRLLQRHNRVRRCAKRFRRGRHRCQHHFLRSLGLVQHNRHRYLSLPNRHRLEPYCPQCGIAEMVRRLNFTDVWRIMYAGSRRIIDMRIRTVRLTLVEFPL